jgi:uncharacterized protein YecT (DUF1311 family)
VSAARDPLSRQSLLLVVVLALGAGVSVANAHGLLKPPVIREPFAVLPCPAKALTTPEMLGCAEKQILSTDRAINALAKRIFSALSPSAHRRFVQSEEDWLRYRRSSCLAEVSGVVGGSIFPIEYAYCELARNRTHLKDLADLRCGLYPQDGLPASCRLKRLLQRRSFPPLILTLHKIGGLTVDGATYLDAVRAFGRPTTAKFPTGSCRIRYARIGLSFYFTNLDNTRGTPRTCTFLLDAVITSPDWRTTNGLRVRASVSMMRRLFPTAVLTSTKYTVRGWGEPYGSYWWWLAIRPHVVLTAYVKHGVVLGLGISMIGH